MKYEVMLGMLFDLLNKRRVTAQALAAKYDISQRSVYRYIDEMICAGVPIDLSRGTGGGIYISDSYKLPRGFMTAEEYRKAIDALLAMDEQLNDETLKSAIGKLQSQIKLERKDLTISGNILIDSGTWGDTQRFSGKLALIERAIEQQERLKIEYVSRNGEQSSRTILPHLLVFKQNIWYVYAFCEVRKAFRLFKLGRIRAIFNTDTLFLPHPYSREDIPLQFWHTEKTEIEATFRISPSALPFAEEWLGIENIVEQEGEHFATVTLPDDQSLVGKILSVGSGFTVLSPSSLAEKVKAEAKKIAEGV